MFEDLKIITDLIDNNTKEKYNLNIKFLYLTFKNDIIGWINMTLALSDKGYRYIYEYEKADLSHIDNKSIIKQRIKNQSKVYIYDMINKKFEYINLYKTCLQILFIVNNDRQYNTFHTEFARINNHRTCDNLVLRINDIRKILNYILQKRDSLLPILLNLDDNFKKEYIKENVSFKNIFLNTVIPKNENNLDTEIVQNNLECRLTLDINFDINNSKYKMLSEFINKSDILYYSFNNELHEFYQIPENKINDALNVVINNNRLVKEFEQQFKNITYDLYVIRNSVTDKKNISLYINLPINKSIFVDTLVYLSMPNLKFI